MHEKLYNKKNISISARINQVAMKFVALVSGGKDSCFNILHCLAQNHELVCMANLKPKDKEVQELDSFMFQTVGHDVLSYYPECVGVPMYRGEIQSGGSKNQQLDYKPTEDDEIEDLYNLLQRVITAHPEVEGVSVGAILSSYQRTRVENVCQRLGLTSLAYLWQRNQLELMTEMVESSMDARLIKVAAIGLNQTHLGKSLKEMFPTMLKLNSKFDVHICGEGGEFESLVLDAPFFIKRLEIVDAKVVSGSNDVSYLEPIVRVVDKVEGVDLEFHNVSEKNVDWKKFITVKESLLEERFQDIYDEVEEFELKKSKETLQSYSSNLKPITHKLDNHLYISNITSLKPTVEEQVTEVFEYLNSQLHKYNLGSSSIQHSTLLISSMEDFAKINSIYVKNFNQPLPPSRVCIQTNIGNSVYLQLSCIVLLDESKKSGLHVQGRSYWAPANIGPYSQAIIDQDLVASLSGQIPLVPSSMELSDKLGKFNVVLSLQHLNNVKLVTGCTNQLSVTCFITNESYVRAAVETWKEYSIINDDPQDCLIVVQVDKLPKNADVEWGGFSYKKVESLYNDDDDDEKEQLQNKIASFGLTKHEFDGYNFSSSLHYTVYCRPELIVRNPVIEYVPVKQTWLSTGELTDYSVVSKA